MKIIAEGDIKVKVVSKAKKKKEIQNEDSKEMVNREPPLHLCECGPGQTETSTY